jgi:predicted nucleic acid-binding protein
MKILVDTSVWSLAFRKKTLTKDEEKIVNELKELIYEIRVVVIGPIRQELLSGLSSKAKFVNLIEKLRAFDDTPIEQNDYEKAAEFYNSCRKKGIQGSHVDFLICAIAINRDIGIFTTDKDFEKYKKIVNIKLHEVRETLDK